MSQNIPHCIAFLGSKRVGRGDLDKLVTRLTKKFEIDELTTILFFDTHFGTQIDIDFRGSTVEIVQRIVTRFTPVVAPESEEPKTNPRGRPKLGVIGREVTLLPRHWDWLASRSGGASATLRGIVELHMRTEPDPRSRDAAYKVMSALAGDLEGFEEASRALFANYVATFKELSKGWPADIRNETLAIWDPTE